MKTDHWIYIFVLSIFIIFGIVFIFIYKSIRSTGEPSLAALTTISTLLNNLATPIVALVAVYLTIKINNTLINQSAEQERNNLEHTKSLATMSVRLEIFKDLKSEYDKMIAITQKIPYSIGGTIPEETVTAYRVWDDKIKQYLSFFPETFDSYEARELQRLLEELQINPSPYIQRNILNAYDQFIARMASEITEATILKEQIVIIEKEDGTQEEHRFNR